MAQTGYTPIINYHSTTGAAIPDAANLVPGELGVNVTDKKIYTEDGGGAVVQIGSGPSATDTFTNKSVSLTNNTVTGTAAEFDTACSDDNFAFQSDIGVSIQAYDADTAKTDVAQTFTASQRATITTDNDGSFDLASTNNFFCTLSGDATLTFTNHTAGQSGFVLLDNTGGHTVSAAATTKVDGSFLTTVSAAGVYLISYLDNGTNAYCVCSGALA